MPANPDEATGPARPGWATGWPAVDRAVAVVRELIGEHESGEEG